MMKFIISDVTYWVGKDAQSNFDLLDQAESKDIWFHVEGAPSAHVIMEVGESWDKKQMRNAITQGAVLCKQHSKSKSDKKVVIVYTAVANVKKTNLVGSVTTSFCKTKVI